MSGVLCWFIHAAGIKLVLATIQLMLNTKNEGFISVQVESSVLDRGLTPVPMALRLWPELPGFKPTSVQ